MSDAQKLVALSFTRDELEEVNTAFTAQFHGGEKTLNKYLKAICLGQIRKEQEEKI